MKWLKAAGAAAVIALALYGGLQLAQGVRNLYADWQFVRAARIQAIQRAQPQAQAATPQQGPGR